MSTIKKLAGFFGIIENSGLDTPAPTWTPPRYRGSLPSLPRPRGGSGYRCVNQSGAFGSVNRPKLTGHYRVNVRWRRKAFVKGWI